MSQIKFPVSIALVGAPGSGKYPVMDEFCSQAKEHPLWEDQEIVALINSGAILEKEYDTPMGVFGDYKENLWAHFNRLEMEYIAMKHGNSFITAGTVLENFAYGGVKIEDIRNGLQTPDAEMRLMREMHATTVLSFLSLDYFKYTFAFYLPLTDSPLVVPGGDAGQTAYATRVDQALRVIFTNFGLRIQVLDKGTPEEKAKIMHDTITQIMTAPDEVHPDIEGEAALVPSGSDDTVDDDDGREFNARYG